MAGGRFSTMKWVPCRPVYSVCSVWSAAAVRPSGPCPTCCYCSGHLLDLTISDYKVALQIGYTVAHCSCSCSCYLHLFWLGLFMLFYFHRLSELFSANRQELTVRVIMCRTRLSHQTSFLFRQIISRVITTNIMTFMFIRNFKVPHFLCHAYLSQESW